MFKKAFVLVSMAMLSIAAMASGSFETVQLKNCKLHVYNSNDVMADASYIVEGKDSLIVLEAPLFKAGDAEFKAYIKKLGKPVAADITDYHEGAEQGAPIILAEGFGSFMKGNIYGGMMAGFKKGFGDSMVELASTDKATEVPFGKTIKIDGISFKFNHGAASDFPAASIIIDGTAYLTHWTPSKSHVSNLQVGNVKAIDAEIAEAKKELASGCTVFIGGHGGKGTKAGVEFKIAYLTKVKQLRAKCKTAESWAAAMKKAYPNLPQEGNLKALSEALYK